MLCAYEDKLKHFNFILASASPQRINLIKTLIPQLTHSLTVQPSSFAEDLDKRLYTPEQYVVSTSYCKAIDVYNTLYSNRKIDSNTVLIAADTIVIDCDNDVIEKATTDTEAFTMLEHLQGTTHKVTTAVTLVRQDANAVTNYKLWDPSDKQRAALESQGFVAHDASHKQPAGTMIKQFTNTTSVTMCHMNEMQLHAYIATQQYKGKAGAYGIQGLASQFISDINGDYYNVVGLPVHQLCAELVEFIR